MSSHLELFSFVKLTLSMCSYLVDDLNITLHNVCALTERSSHSSFPQILHNTKNDSIANFVSVVPSEMSYTSWVLNLEIKLPVIFHIY